MLCGYSNFRIYTSVAHHLNVDVAFLDALRGGNRSEFIAIITGEGQSRQNDTRGRNLRDGAGFILGVEGGPIGGLGQIAIKDIIGRQDDNEVEGVARVVALMEADLGGHGIGVAGVGDAEDGIPPVANPIVGGAQHLSHAVDSQVYGMGRGGHGQPAHRGGNRHGDILGFEHICSHDFLQLC